jgi:hypothetical protein
MNYNSVMVDFFVAAPLVHLLVVALTYFSVLLGLMIISFGIHSRQDLWKSFLALTISLLLLGCSAVIIAASHHAGEMQQTTQTR